MPPDAETRRRWREAALVLVAHGSAGDRRAMAATEAHREALAAAGLFAEVRAGYLAGGPPIEEVLAEVAADRIHLVPHFMSDGFFTRRRIPERLGIEGPRTVRAGKLLLYARPPALLPGFPRLVAAALGRACATLGRSRAEVIALLVAHGTERDPAQERWARAVAEGIEGYAAVRTAFVEQRPLLSEALEELRGPVAVAGLFAADGFHAETDVRALLTGTEQTVRPTPQGAEIAYTGAIGADPAMRSLILEAAASVDVSEA